jgi:hypothetical protein
MKKSELKNIIKECVKEVIFEDGILSGIITEVATGLTSLKPINETKNRNQSDVTTSTSREAKKKVLAAVGQQGYADVKRRFANPELFEGTNPLPAGDGQGALSGMSPNDPGIDITKLPGMGDWASVAQGKKR